jgi:hypothetical protein
LETGAVVEMMEIRINLDPDEVTVSFFNGARQPIDSLVASALDGEPTRVVEMQIVARCRGVPRQSGCPLLFAETARDDGGFDVMNGAIRFSLESCSNLLSIYLEVPSSSIAFAIELTGNAGDVA